MKKLRMEAFLDICEEIEQAVAELYHFYADHFTDEAVVRLWRETAIEEENHARQVRLAKKLLSAISGLRVDTRFAQGAHSFIMKYLDDVRKLPPPLEEALGAAIRFEEKMGIFHMENVVVFEERAGLELFRALMKDDRDHVEALQAELNRLAAAAEVQAA